MLALLYMPELADEGGPHVNEMFSPESKIQGIPIPLNSALAWALRQLTWGKGCTIYTALYLCLLLVSFQDNTQIFICCFRIFDK